MTTANGNPPPSPQAVHNARCREIDATLARMPPILRSFVLEHLDAIQTVDRLKAADRAYVLDFVLDLEALAERLLSLPVWTPLQPPQPERTADHTIRGSGR